MVTVTWLIPLPQAEGLQPNGRPRNVPDGSFQKKEAAPDKYLEHIGILDENGILTGDWPGSGTSPFRTMRAILFLGTGFGTADISASVFG